MTPPPRLRAPFSDGRPRFLEEGLEVVDRERSLEEGPAAAICQIDESLVGNGELGKLANQNDCTVTHTHPVKMGRADAPTTSACESLKTVRVSTLSACPSNERRRDFRCNRKGMGVG